METSCPFGSSESRGQTHLLRYELRLPHPVDEVWEAVATPEGLPGWLAAAEPFEQRQGGAITLRWLNTDEQGNATVAPGRVTAWVPKRVAEYTVDVHGRVRFELEPADGGTLLRFVNEMTGPDAERLSCLAGWHNHFEYLREALAGRPKDWSTWTLDHWRELYAEYERRGA
ncbi:putative conserved protein YndB, AHSA1/START domain [Streptoalloteichus tenebrarius]|uniref:Conserved protein YndB, AHSA1/START domain n=1 Tax=Streptoalloteichus tenebrarius (strain ATCC 17920 / DSM 40477 / JCM 4838 / CBS 697.72 / NBRC 16177 / NCIMB 11028 / NRRL B-12390 / A12253. 1 / ISP 5477) TaxID=1933 RepID=A0ABT1HYW5_STRSD|nr:SRPBCC domain-containing protein [Streptoalloteichus tenebrarius]MCP2260721.1 putative conserved protein YndB, AHSA1/START domain [Streptoalloteichus tenebrarius]BFF03745.1 hypothetical protein GCM10020241_54200 [Streptoalloteichus tenebrarius]